MDIGDETPVPTPGLDYIHQKGVVLGVYDGCNPGEFKPTPTFARFNEKAGGRLMKVLEGANLKQGEAQVFSNVSNDFNSVAVAHLGKEGVSYNEMEKLDECKENIRVAAAVGARALQDNDIGSVFIEGFTNAEPAAEGAILGLWRYQDLKSPSHQFSVTKVDTYENEDTDGWMRGKVKADNQNFARRLEDTPANLMTPTIVAKMAIDALCPCGIAVEVKDIDWIENQKMLGFLLMAKGSCEPPMFIEMNYCGAEESPPVVLVAKGFTFDSGGLCLKNCNGMSEYRADMAGAAVVIAVMKTVAMMSLPINVVGLIPLAENMIGGMSARPGDIVRTRSGKSVRVEDTDNEGRVALADALDYAHFYNPCLIINVATLTPGIKKGLGTGASGLFTNRTNVFREFERAGAETGDRLWRLPLWNFYRKRVTDSNAYDVHNIGIGDGNPPLGAAFLAEFAKKAEFAHIDITGTGMSSNGVGHPYYRKDNMTGRPMRTIFQFLYQIACPHDKGDDC